ncbi:hypothetical protein AWB74_07417 [Caballeronia arvi]|uniref:Uncharacterized protein n=1 Tax=Caballeronia arvi TaxID=1777135 RepID=A0A158KXB3_9BURK|nr:hypothetical protein AWB74_07417 [Caballeronia arvi]
MKLSHPHSLEQEGQHVTHGQPIFHESHEERHEAAAYWRAREGPCVKGADGRASDEVGRIMQPKIDARQTHTKSVKCTITSTPGVRVRKTSSQTAAAAKTTSV